jgi:aryl-alcohol dehydrogenase-like predicted oxidoreductase
MYDDFFEQGGNCFDSAYIYSGGASEKMLGYWMKNRGLREQVVLLAKNSFEGSFLSAADKAARIAEVEAYAATH